MRMVLVLGAVAAVTLQTRTQSTQMPYPKMAPVDQYLIADRNAEIALARSAAPESISGKAEVMVLGRGGYEIAVPGTNDFVCMVERAWDAATGDPNFWNPKIRGPNCLNAAAARSFLPIALMKTRLALGGKSQVEIGEAIQAAFALDRKELPRAGVRARCATCCRSSGYLDDRGTELASPSDVFRATGHEQNLGGQSPRFPGSFRRRCFRSADHLHGSSRTVVGWNSRFERQQMIWDRNSSFSRASGAKAQ